MLESRPSATGKRAATLADELYPSHHIRRVDFWELMHVAAGDLARDQPTSRPSDQMASRRRSPFPLAWARRSEQ
ncbi:MAG: hypothetical protein WBP81_21080 [Solirubrobacteraceae bacterium]